MPSLTGKQMWAALFLAVIYHEFACKKGELLSEEADRAVARHPELVHAFAFVTVAHLLNWLPERIDPYHRGFLLIHHAAKRWRRYKKGTNK